MTESRAVLAMKMEIRPASKGSSGEGVTMSKSKLVEIQRAWSVTRAKENTQLQHQDHDSTYLHLLHLVLMIRPGPLSSKKQIP